MHDSTPPKRKKLSKLFFILVGHISLGLGVIGIIIPLLPTTPFLLLSAACYLRGSEKLYNWLINQPRLGTFITNYREGKGISFKVKITLILLIWITIPFSAIFLIEQLYIRLLLFVIALVVSTSIWRIPTHK